MNSNYFVNQLTTEEMLLVNSEIEKRKKSPAVAYLLWLFLGTIGGHRYYMGKIGSAVAMTLITILTLGFGIVITGIWALVDLFFINGWLLDNQQLIENNVAQAILNRKQAQQYTQERQKTARQKNEYRSKSKTNIQN